MNIIRFQHYHSPAGELILGSFEEKLCLCCWQKDEDSLDRIAREMLKKFNANMEEESGVVLESAVCQLNEYFARERKTFEIPLLFAGTDFQEKVWNHLLTIPYGMTISYGEMAKQLGCPKAVRAVANANGANAVSIFAPCHRVIGSDGSLTGYGGGLKAKKVLLVLENAVFNNDGATLF